MAVIGGRSEDRISFPLLILLIKILPHLDDLHRLLVSIAKLISAFLTAFGISEFGPGRVGLKLSEGSAWLDLAVDKLVGRSGRWDVPGSWEGVLLLLLHFLELCFRLHGSDFELIDLILVVGGLCHCLLFQISDMVAQLHNEIVEFLNLLGQ